MPGINTRPFRQTRLIDALFSSAAAVDAGWDETFDLQAYFV
jgi:hypothetical protein